MSNIIVIDSRNSVVRRVLYRSRDERGGRETKTKASRRRKFYFYFLKGGFFGFFLFMYDIQHCFICRPSDSTVSEDARIEPGTVATTALAVRRSNHSANSHPQSARSHPQLG
jgi:hypothetical protein